MVGLAEGGVHPTEVAAAHGAAFFGGGIVGVGEVIAAVGDVKDDLFFEGGGFEFVGHALGFVKVDVEFANEAGVFAREGFVTLGDDIGGAGVAEDGIVDLCAEAVMDEVNTAIAVSFGIGVPATAPEGAVAVNEQPKAIGYRCRISIKICICS